MEKITKLRLTLSRNVGKQCEVELADGQVVYGTFDSYEISPNAILIAVHSSNGQNVINFHYVKKVRFPKTEAKAETINEGVKPISSTENLY